MKHPLLKLWREYQMQFDAEKTRLEKANIHIYPSFDGFMDWLENKPLSSLQETPAPKG